MHRPPANAAAHAHAALAAARFLLLAAALMPASARCGREMTLRAFSDEVRGRVVDRLAEALGDKAFASVSVGGVVTFAADGFLFVQCDGEGLKVETKPGAGPAATAGDSAWVGRVTVNADPRPRPALSARTRPPCRAPARSPRR